METFFLLFFLGIVCFVFFVYKCFTSDWYKSEQFFIDIQDMRTILTI